MLLPEELECTVTLVDSRYAEAAWRIWKTYVPPRGGQHHPRRVLRAVEKLRGEAQRNVNTNWDEHHEGLWAHLHEKLTGSGPFVAETSQQLITDPGSAGRLRAPARR